MTDHLFVEARGTKLGGIMSQVGPKIAALKHVGLVEFLNVSGLSVRSLTCASNDFLHVISKNFDFNYK